MIPPIYSVTAKCGDDKCAIGNFSQGMRGRTGNRPPNVSHLYCPVCRERSEIISMEEVKP